MASQSPNLRSRHTASTAQNGSVPSTAEANTPPDLASKEDKIRFSVLDILRVLAGLLLLSSSLSYFITGDSVFWGYRPPLTRPARLKAWLRGPISLTDAELAAYDGSNPNLPIYLALNGSIYDVSVSPHFYGPGGSYSFFAGRDATRAYVTGCFDEDLTPDLRGVEEMFVPVDGGDEGREEGEEIEAGKGEEGREEEG
ncbi:cytochrome P450 [Physcia stellaris]|nr:cytochrome P450 [Physcia stellaris]